MLNASTICLWQGFDAATYIVGPEEELPRRLECFTFVMHAPDDYFYYRHAPYPTKSHAPDQGGNSVEQIWLQFWLRKRLEIRYRVSNLVILVAQNG